MKSAAACSPGATTGWVLKRSSLDVYSTHFMILGYLLPLKRDLLQKCDNMAAGWTT
jgi:hypothetical protein